MLLATWFLPAVSLREHRLLLDCNFRRSRRNFVRPECPGCDLCRQIRVPVGRFRASRSQRRVLRRNADLVVRETDAFVDDERAVLYRRYLETRHPGSPQGSSAKDLEAIFEDATYDGGFVFETRDPAGRLVAVSFVHRVQGGLSSAYCFFDPDEPRRSLGTFTILWEIEWCRREGLAFYYLGYWIRGCRTMEYKARFLPHEVFDPANDVFVEVGRRARSAGAR